MWSVVCGVRSVGVACGVLNVVCGVWSVACGVWSMECRACCAVCGARWVRRVWCVEYGVCAVCGVW